MKKQFHLDHLQKIVKIVKESPTESKRKIETIIDTFILDMKEERVEREKKKASQSSIFPGFIRSKGKTASGKN